MLLRKILLLPALALVCCLAAPAVAQGPLALLGIDGEDGNGTFGSAHGGKTPYTSVMADILTNVSNGGTGIIVIGGGKSVFDDVTEFWTVIAGNVGEPVSFVNGSGNITAQSFAGFKVIAVASSSPQTPSGGLTSAENIAFAAKAGAVATHVNGGGGLMGLSQTGISAPYAYLGNVGGGVNASFVGNYNNVTATAAGLAVGITNTNLDVCCWHDIYASFPAFLNVLATRVLGGGAAAIGGAGVVITQAISLSPANATNNTGTNHTVTATVVDSNNNPVVNTPVTFTVTAGPNTGANGASNTDANGQASFTYTGSGGIGTDTIQACFVNANNQTICATASKDWVNAPPDCTNAAPSQSELWPPNHQFVPITITGVTDPEGDPITITIDSIFQDEPVTGTGQGAGNTSPDGQGVGTSTAEVRAERNGNRQTPGNGRVYHITFTASDGQGGTCTATVTVCVPHDQRPGHVCIDEGPLFDSTGT